MTYVISFQTTTPEVLKETKRISATHQEAIESIEFCRDNGMTTATEIIFGLPGESLETLRDVINKTLSYGFDSVSIVPLWLLKGSDLNTSHAREKYEYVGRYMLAESALTSHKEFYSYERDEIAVQSKYYSFNDWLYFLKYQINLLLLSYFGYGKEMIMYATNCLEIKPTDLWDYIFKNPERFPVTNEIAKSYTERYLSTLFQTEKELEGFIGDNIENFRKNKEELTKVNHSRNFYDFIVNYIFADDENKYLYELKRAIFDLGNEEQNINEEIDSIYNFTIDSIINPFSEFIPEINSKSNYNIGKWIKDGYKTKLCHYKLKNKQEVTLKCKNKLTVRESIKADKEQKRTDCFNFFRYMNSGLMRRYVFDLEFVFDESTPWEPFRREHRTISEMPALKQVL